MNKASLTRRGSNYARSHMAPSDTLQDFTAMRLAWEDGYQSARRDLRRVMKAVRDTQAAQDSMLSADHKVKYFGSIVGTVFHWLKPLR